MTSTGETRLTWTCEEAAALTGVPTRTVQGLCARGEWPATRIAGRWYVLAPQLCNVLGVPMPDPLPPMLVELQQMLLATHELVAQLITARGESTKIAPCPSTDTRLAPLASVGPPSYTTKDAKSGSAASRPDKRPKKVRPYSSPASSSRSTDGVYQRISPLGRS